MANKLPPAKDWRARGFKNWNAATLRAYMEEQHEERFGLPYVTNNIPVEATNMKRMINKHGAKVVKAFVDECFDSYQPSPQYPSINFMFMYSFMRERNLPKVLLKTERKQEESKPKQSEAPKQSEDVLEWL